MYNFNVLMYNINVIEMERLMASDTEDNREMERGKY